MIPSLRFNVGPVSPIKGVTDSAWRRFVDILDIQPINAISQSGGLGSYDIRPRRLVELGYASDLRSARTSSGRQIRVCEFILPWTQARFLTDPVAQYAALSRSISLYHKDLTDGKLKPPEGVSMSGVLMVLHVGGKGALEGWPKLFENTRARFEAARGAF